MSNNFEKIWEIYTSSWKAESSNDKRELYEKCLDVGCIYNDPMVVTTGWDELLKYMLDFHKQIPGGHFITNYFLAHHNQSIAKWKMKDGDNNMLGEGISFGKYSESGKLVSMTGFFETAEGSVGK